MKTVKIQTEQGLNSKAPTIEVTELQAKRLEKSGLVRTLGGSLVSSCTADFLKNQAGE